MLEVWFGALCEWVGGDGSKGREGGGRQRKMSKTVFLLIFLVVFLFLNLSLNLSLFLSCFRSFFRFR